MSKMHRAVGVMALVAIITIAVLSLAQAARATGTITNTTWPQLKCRYCGCCQPIKTQG